MTKSLALCCLLPIIASAGVCNEQFSVGTSYVPYCSNGKTGPAVIVIHGVDRNADDYLAYMSDMTTLVIVPEFQAQGPGLYWSSGWSEGNKSLDSTRTSSFEVMDRMVVDFGAVAVIGHSAGGQFVNRYASGTRIRGLSYIVANPGSYLWLDGTRPESTAGCPSYNQYKYGFESPNSYMSRGLAPTYANRDVIYLLGELDTEIDANLNTGCRANAQGANRYERGVNFFLHLNDYFGQPTHRLIVVPNVGHSASQMLQAAKAYLPQKKAGCGAECHLGVE